MKTDTKSSKTKENTVATFRTPHTPHVRVTAQATVGQSKTHQSFKDQCDINRIMAKAAKTGLIPSTQREPVYGDFASMPDFQEAQNIVLRSQQQFAALDAKVRAKFNNDPAKFLEWASDGSNAEEMATLGLLKPEAVKRVQDAKAASQKDTSQGKEAKS